eukprot:CAMPEP_0170566560 /NCGR_PEP_ID=MMETSP0211-20121228/79920_1 /TAXON_ID=311385 /ORGANISM="Pseudokeronopsis sp., Strain OXSARD2" /LENGTH=92 /DNA_ID=CAMNT_0010887777 /DNA_START=793 /DNA_END=1071 /DNA_ORIENTATION=+
MEVGGLHLDHVVVGDIDPFLKLQGCIKHVLLRLHGIHPSLIDAKPNDEDDDLESNKEEAHSDEVSIAGGGGRQEGIVEHLREQDDEADHRQQ